MGDAYRDMLRGLTRFDFYSDGELDELLEACEVVENRPGEVLFSEGDPGDWFCVILNGEYMVRRGGNGHPPEDLAVLGPGDVVGESVLDLAKPTRRADLVAARLGVVLKITKEHLAEATAARAPWVAKLMTHFAQILAVRLRELDEVYHQLWEKGREGRKATNELQAFRRNLQEKWKL